MVSVLSPVRKGGAGVDKEGGLDVFTTFGLARSQGINPGERLMELRQKQRISLGIVLLFREVDMKSIDTLRRPEV